MRTEPTDFLRRRLREIVQPVRWHACPRNDRPSLSIIVDETFIRSIFGHFRCVLILRQMVLASNVQSHQFISFQDTFKTNL